MFLDVDYLLELQQDLAKDCLAFLPELLLCVGIVVLMLIRLAPSARQTHLSWMALFFTLAAFFVSLGQWLNHTWFLAPLQLARATLREELFSGLLVFDNLTVFLRLFLFGTTALLIWLGLLTGIPDAEDSADFNVLLLGSTVGMALMAAANHLLVVYLAVEMASLPSYALAGFLKGRRRSSEAALKYVVYGGGAAAVMLYGISLLAGRFGTAYLPDLARCFALALESQGGATDPVLLLGTFFLLVGFAFKLSLVPFHFWCPDVFEGAAAEVAGFLSVASKGAALALTGRFVLILAGLTHQGTTFAHWQRVADFLVPSLAILAIVTATFGNLAAYPQTNLKRLLAYSTIAHAGYMLMGLATLNPDGLAAVLFYLVAYLFMNLGAFAIVAFLRNLSRSEEISSFRGLVYRAPILTILLAIFLLSLLGLPPLAGFAAKFQIFAALYDAGTECYAVGAASLGNWMYAMLVLGGINTVVSAAYYLRVIKAMTLEKPVAEIEGVEPDPYEVPVGATFYGSVLAIGIVVLGILWNPLATASDKGTLGFERIEKLARPALAAREVKS